MSVTKSSNGFIFGDYCLAEELVSQILIHLDVKMLAQCRLVCRSWQFIIEQPLFWKHKAELDKKRWTKIPLDRNINWSFYANVYIHEPFGRNLIKNPNGIEQLNHWNVLSEGGDGFDFEQPPIGSQNVPVEAEENMKQIENSCFVTSYHSCSKEQIIDLSSLGLHCEIMDNYKPKIIFTDWYAGRFDCGCVYDCEFALLDETNQELECYRNRFRVEEGDDTCFQKVNHCFEKYPNGVKYLKFYHGGQDTKFWAGRYGAKMTGSSVFISF